MVPDVDDVLLLAVEDHVADEVDRPGGGARGALVLPPLPLGPTDDAEGADEVANQEADVLEPETFGAVFKADLVEVMEEVEPGAGVAGDVEELDTGEDVIEGGEVDEGVDGGGHAEALGAPGAHHGADRGGAVEAHDEGDVAVIYAVGDLEAVGGVDLRGGEADGGHDLLDAVGVVDVGRLARLVARLAEGVGVQVAEEGGAVVDAGVGGVMQRGRQAVGGGQGARVHDHIREGGPVDAGKEFGHVCEPNRRRGLYTRGEL